MIVLLVLTGCAEPSQVELQWFVESTGDATESAGPDFRLNVSLTQSEAAGCPVEGSPAAYIEGMGEGERQYAADEGRFGCRGHGLWTWGAGKGGGPYEVVLPAAGEMHLDYGPEPAPELLGPPSTELLEPGSEIRVQLPLDLQGEITVEPFWQDYLGSMASCVDGWVEEDGVLTLQVLEEATPIGWPYMGHCGDTITLALADDALADAISRCDFDSCRVRESFLRLHLQYEFAQADAR